MGRASRNRVWARGNELNRFDPVAHRQVAIVDYIHRERLDHDRQTCSTSSAACRARGFRGSETIWRSWRVEDATSRRE